MQFVLQSDGVVLQLQDLLLELVGHLGALWLRTLPAEVPMVVDVLQLVCQHLSNLLETVDRRCQLRQATYLLGHGALQEQVLVK